MIAAFEGAPGVGKSTVARSLRREGVAVVPEVNRLFLRPKNEPADWYLDRQNARWEIAAHAERAGRTALLDGDPLQPLWFGWLFPDENWTSVATAASFFMDRVRSGRMRLPDHYILLTLYAAEQARRLHGREVARGLAEFDANAKVRRYASFAAPQRQFFGDLAKRFPGWVSFIDAADPGTAAQVSSLLKKPATPPDSIEALSYAAEWLRSHSAADCRAAA